MKVQDPNEYATHPLQAKEWGEFREKTGIKVIRSSLAGQLTIHKIPYMPFKIGYLPKGPMPTKKMIDELVKIGQQENCIFIQLEPNIPLKNTPEVTERAPRGWNPKNLGLRPSARPLFTKYTFQLDLTKSEDELLKNMQPKTRYNIRVAQKHGVEVSEDNSDKTFRIYLKLTKETTKRQGFYAHDERYHRLMWETLKVESGKFPPKADPPLEEKVENFDRNKLTAHLLVARYKYKSSNSQLSTLNSQLVLVAWILFVFKDTLYYPYGASSDKYREAMASNLMMWEAIRFGKKMGLKKFDMWGSLGPNPDKNNPWYGFHRFKEGYGGKLVEFVGSYDLVIKPFWYQLYVLADRLRWLYLKVKQTSS